MPQSVLRPLKCAPGLLVDKNRRPVNTLRFQCNDLTFFILIQAGNSGVSVNHILHLKPFLSETYRTEYVHVIRTSSL